MTCSDYELDKYTWLFVQNGDTMGICNLHISLSMLRPKKSYCIVFTRFIDLF